MKTSTFVFFIAIVIVLILHCTSSHAREFDDFLERRAGGATNWENEDNLDNNRWFQTLLQRAASRGSGLFSEEKRGSSKAIDHKLDSLHFALWCRRMNQQNALCK